MGKAKFIDNVKELFGIKSDEEKKKDAIKELLKKLEARKSHLRKELHKEEKIEKIEALKDSIKIVKMQIKKGKKLLNQ